eukprot:1143131-Pelagomonas_calceolata.AAC.2
MQSSSSGGRGSNVCRMRCCGMHSSHCAAAAAAAAGTDAPRWSAFCKRLRLRRSSAQGRLRHACVGMWGLSACIRVGNEGLETRGCLGACLGGCKGCVFAQAHRCLDACQAACICARVQRCKLATTLQLRQWNESPQLYSFALILLFLQHHSGLAHLHVCAPAPPQPHLKSPKNAFPPCFVAFPPCCGHWLRLLLAVPLACEQAAKKQH